MKKDNNYIERILVDLFLLFSLFLLPWWIFWPLAILMLFKYESYYELIFLAVLSDSIYSVPGIFIFSKYIFTISSITTFFVVSWLKERVIVYR
jgi:hypothetical protein